VKEGNVSSPLENDHENDDAYEDDDFKNE